MATYDASLNNGGRGFTLRLTVNQVSQNVANNTSLVSWSLDLIRGVQSFSYDPSSWSVNIGGQGTSGSISSYDFRLYSTLNLGSGSYTITHDADGSKTISASGSFSQSPVHIGNGTASGTLTLTTIPRATQPTVSPTSGETGVSYTIGHAPAASSFFHDLAYSVDAGASYTTLATNIPGTTTSSSWTPAASLFPSSGTGTAIIRLITRQTSGGTIIGTKTVNLPLTVPASLKPTISATGWSDAQTSGPDIPTLMGGPDRYVQLWSRLVPTLTSGGAGGSTVVSSQITQNGQQTTSGAAFTNAIALSGSVPFSAVVTDTRGRNSDTFTGTVSVAAYNYPNLPTPLVSRTSDAGGSTPSPTGTYLAITPAASVSSLVFGGVEKNLIEWRVRIKQVGGAYTTVQDWTATGVSGNVWTTKYVAAGPYSAANEYVVEVSVRDLFGKNGFRTTQTVVTTEVPVASESVFMDWDGDNGIGLGKYRQNGILDVAGTIYMNGDKVVAVDHTGLVEGNVPVWDATASEWVPGEGGGGVNFDTTPPASGTFWLDPETGTLYVYYVDADGGQWIETGVGGGSIPGRNKIINGTFRTNQRAYASAGSLASGAFGHDRWKANAATTSYTFTAAPQGQIITIASGKGIRQDIERANVEAGDYVLSWTGTATGRVYNVGGTPPAYAASPVQVTLDGTADVVVEFTASGGTKTLHKVQFESGHSPTVFEDIPVDEELRKCQRYFVYWSAAQDEHVLGTGLQAVNTYARFIVPLPVPMRIPPTMAYSDVRISNNNTFNVPITGWQTNPARMSGASLFLAPTHAAAGTATAAAVLQLGTSGWMSASAEL